MQKPLSAIWNSLLE